MLFNPLPNTFIVGLGHKARNGKGTVAEIFLDYFGGAAKEFAFADALKMYCRVMRGMTTKDPALLQQVGTDEFREKDIDVWARAAYYTIAEKAPRLAILSDVRFPNEAQMVKDMGGVLVEVIRYAPSGKRFIDPSRPANHPSETALDGYAGYNQKIEADNLQELRYLAHLLAEDVAKKIDYEYTA